MRQKSCSMPHTHTICFYNSSVVAVQGSLHNISKVNKQHSRMPCGLSGLMLGVGGVENHCTSLRINQQTRIRWGNNIIFNLRSQNILTRLRMQLTGYGLLPWSVVKQNLLLIAIQRAALNANGTLEYGACNVSTSVSDISDMLALLNAAPAPVASSRGRRRLINSHSVQLESLYEPDLPIPILGHPLGDESEGGLGKVQSLGSGCDEGLESPSREMLSKGGEGCGCGERACVGHRRKLLASTAKNDTIEIYLRLDAMKVDQTASDYWATLSGPLGNTSEFVFYPWISP